MMLTKAIHYAAAFHAGQVRKGTDIPYIVHPMEACAIAATMTADAEMLSAAVLHDVVEDCGVTISMIETYFSPRVAKLVGAQSEKKEADEAGSWLRRKQHTIDWLKTSATKEEKMLTLADKLSNMRAISRDYRQAGDSLWARFNQKDKREHAKYYRGIRDALSELSEYEAFGEFSTLVDSVFSDS